MGLEFVSAKPTFFETAYTSRGELCTIRKIYPFMDMPLFIIGHIVMTMTSCS